MEMACDRLLQKSCYCSYMETYETSLPPHLQTEMKLKRLLWFQLPTLAPGVARRQRQNCFWWSQLQPAPKDMKLQHRLGHFEAQKAVTQLVVVVVVVVPIMTAPMTNAFPLIGLPPHQLPLTRPWIALASSLVD